MRVAKTFTLPPGQSVSELCVALREWHAANTTPQQGFTLEVVLTEIAHEVPRPPSVGHPLEDM